MNEFHHSIMEFRKQKGQGRRNRVSKKLPAMLCLTIVQYAIHIHVHLYVRCTYNLNKYNFTDVNISVCMYCTYIFTKKEGSLNFLLRLLCAFFMQQVPTQSIGTDALALTFWRVAIRRTLFFSSFRSLCYCADAV